ncbi:MliC family protein [Bergeyella porcorum]|uniref:MliC family protein n=1 Tax=Bergeyella porcorum TaxID=1735111 RepID=UPI0035EFE18B
MKKIFFAAMGAALVLTACNKKEQVETETVVVEEPVKVDSVTTDSVAVASDVVTANYVSNDGKTKFKAVFNTAEGTAEVTNETTGKVYQMKSAVSASGSKFEDADKNFFWTSKEGFMFGNGDTTEIEGKEVK